MFSTLHEALEHNRQTQNPVLDLGNLGLNGTERELEQLKDFEWVESLILTHSWNEYDKEKMEWEYNKSRNHGKVNMITQLLFKTPPKLTKLVVKWQNIQQLILIPNLLYLDIGINNLNETLLLEEFISLESIILFSNKIKEIDFFKKFDNLNHLCLNNNKIHNIEVIYKLHKLRFLDIGHNQIDDISQLNTLRNIEFLDVRYNKIKYFPPDLLDKLPHINRLYLMGNPIENIPRSIFDKNTDVLQEVKAYFRSLKEDEAIPNDEVKLVWLGNATAGKSSIFRYLQDRQHKRGIGSTHGIENVLWSPTGKDFKVNVWDFGGQEFYHATHRLFLSQNAVNVVVFEEQTNESGELLTTIHLYKNNELVKENIPLEHFHFTYWLDSLQHWAGKPDALLVQNKLDCGQIVPIKEQEKNTYHITEDHIFRLSIKSAHEGKKKFVRDFENFEEALLDVLERTKATYAFSKKQMEIKHRLREVGKTQYFFKNYQDYVDFCEAIRPNISEVRDGTSMLNVFTDYAQQIGVLLYFPKVSEKIFINHRWLIDTFYRILDYGVLQNKGEFVADERLTYICTEKGISTEEAIKLMKAFELIFEVEKKGKTFFVAPQYLPTLAEKVRDNEDFLDLIGSHKV